MMELSTFASTLLYGSTWEEKLVSSADGFSDKRRAPPLTELPRFPGRPPKLARFGRAEFPTAESLVEDSARGRLLHFFANHELLALELMALTLLKFPDADPSFRLGLARTIAEEQKHLRMYVHRMRQLGVDFGELPVSEYFWTALKDGRSPLEFVVQMSLTLEQANLDYSLHYQRAVSSVGDTATAALLETVYREEIGHVKHGVTWFNRWRKGEGDSPADEDDWDAYVRLLPPPMSPRRGKGPIYCIDARREAGLSERYIREMDVYSGSRGRPPSYWIFNPLCEAAIASGNAAVAVPETVRNLIRDLETVPAFLAREADIVLVDEAPRTDWLKSLQAAGLTLPEFRKRGAAREAFPERHLAGVEPWGWGPDAFELFRSTAPKLIAIEGGNGSWSRTVLTKPAFAETQLGPLFSKCWSVDFYRQWMKQHPDDAEIFGFGTVGRVFDDWDSVREFVEATVARGETLLAKAPWGTSGRMNKRVADRELLAGPVGKWIRQVLDAQGAIVLEPWLEKVADLSLQIDVGAKTRVRPGRQFLTGKQSEYRGTVLGPGWDRLTVEEKRFLHSGTSETSPLSRWYAMAEAVGAALYAAGYSGNAGIDALLAKQGDRLFFRPIVEINPRWTMGRVALALEEHVLPATPAAWFFLPEAALKLPEGPRTFKELGRGFARRHPVKRATKSGREWIAEGILCTNDPETAREVLTVLAVGTEALLGVPRF